MAVTGQLETSVSHLPQNLARYTQFGRPTFRSEHIRATLLGYSILAETTFSGFARDALQLGGLRQVWPQGGERGGLGLPVALVTHPDWLPQDHELPTALVAHPEFLYYVPPRGDTAYGCVCERVYCPSVRIIQLYAGSG